MELAIVDDPFGLCLDGVEAVLRGVVVTVDLAVSTPTDGPHDLDGGWIKGEGEVQLLCGGNGLGRDFDDLEGSHEEIGGKSRGEAERERGREKAGVRARVAGASGKMRRRGLRGVGW